MASQKITSQTFWSIFALIALPWLQLLIYRGWIFTSANQQIDPWVYLGYMLRLKQYLKAFAGTYYGTRLSWILPGQCLYRLFPPILANYALHLGVYYLAIISLFLVLKHYFGSRTGLVTAVAMGCYPYFLLAVGWDYVDGVGIAYCLLTVLMLTYASINRYRRLALFLSGFFYGALVISNIAWIICTPSLLIYYFVSNCFYQKRLLLNGLLLITAGWIAIIFLLGLINYFIGGDLLFYLPSLNFVLNTIDKSSFFSSAWSVWLPKALWLLLPICAFIVSILLLSLNSIRMLALNSSAINFHLCFIVFFSIQTILGLKAAVFLQTHYYASYLMPFLFLAIGSQLSSILERLRKLSLGLVLGLLIFISFTFLLAYPLAKTWPPHYPYLAFAYCILYLFGICSLSLIQTRIAHKVAITACLTLVLTLTMPTLITALRSPDIEHRDQQEEEYLATIDASKILKSIDPKVQLVFWYNLDEANVYRAIASTYLWGYRLINENFPVLSNPNMTVEQLQQYLKLHPKIVILSKRRDPFFQMAVQSLNKIGFQAKLLTDYSIKQGQQSFTMTIIEVAKTSLQSIKLVNTKSAEVGE